MLNGIVIIIIILKYSKKKKLIRKKFKLFEQLENPKSFSFRSFDILNIFFFDEFFFHYIENDVDECGSSSFFFLIPS